jgi:hypothetical protein
VKKAFIITILLSLVLVFMAGLGQAVPSASAEPALQGGGVGRIRFGNATVTGSPVRVSLDNIFVANKLFDLVGYFTFNSGPHTVTFYTEESGEVIASTQLTLENATRMTVLLTGTRSQPTIVVTLDDAKPTVRGESRFRVVNAVQGSLGAPVTLSGNPLVDNLAFGAASDEFSVRAGTYTLQLGDGQAFEVILLPSRYYYFAIAGSVDTGATRLVDFLGKPYRVGGFNRFRFMNLVEGSDGSQPVYHVHVNGDAIPVFNDVPFGQATNEVVVQPGNYEFELYSPGTAYGSAPALATYNVDIAQDQSIFLIASGTPDAIQFSAYSDDVEAVPVNTARLQVINLTTAVPEFAVVGLHNTPLVDQAPRGSLVSAEIPGGLYALSLVDVNNPANQVGRAEVNAPSGSLATLVIYGSDRPRWLWFNEPLPQVASVRMVHASRKMGNIDIYLNDQLILSNFAYLNTTDYISLEPDNYRLAVFATGADPASATPLWTDNLTITGNALAFTFVAIGEENFRVNVYADNLELIPQGQARVRFITAITNVDSISFINAANAGTLWGGLAFGQGSDNLNLDANTRTFNVNQTGAGPLYRIESFPLVAGAYYTFIVVGDANAPQEIDLILLERLP